MPAPVRKISTTQIAKLAGVSTAAVSQWRKRHPDTFPEALPGKGRAILFDRAAVIAWLKANGRQIREEGGPEDALRGVVDASRIGEVLLCFAANASVESLDGVPSPLREEINSLLSEAALQDIYVDLVGRYTVQELLEAADRAFERPSRGDDFSTPAIVADFVAALVPNSPRQVFDYACGTGVVLQALHNRFPTAMLHGSDISSTAVALAQARSVANHWDASWANHDALDPDTVPTGSFDLVCSNPPFGLITPKGRLEENPERWPYGVPGRRDDTKWLQLAHNSLGDGGVGIIHVLLSTLGVRQAGSALPQMIADGSLLAVISLPGNLLPGTSVPSAIVVFSKNPDRVSDSVLFGVVPAAGFDEAGRRVSALDVGDVLSAYRRHMSGDAVSPSSSSVQVSRLDLMGAEKTLLPAYWVNSEQAPSADELRESVMSTAAKIESIGAIEDELEDLAFRQGASVRRIPLNKFPGIQQILRPSDEDLRSGDICVGPSNVSVCETDQQRPAGGLIQVVRCDPGVADPWFLAVVIDTVRRSGALDTGSGLRFVDLRLVDVPNISIAEQQKLGNTVKVLRQRRAQAEEQAHRWGDLASSVGDAITAGAATSRSS